MIEETMSTAKQKISDQDILRVMSEADAPAVTAKEVSDHLGVTRQAISYRLDKLAEQDVVDCKGVGSRSVIWWTIDD